MKLSICYMVKNEILNLPESIYNSQGLADEIVIVDTGSTDGTKQYSKFIANRYDDFKWCDDFSKVRNRTFDIATGDWILVLDADEWIEKKHHIDVRKLMERQENSFGFTIWNFLHDPRWVSQPRIFYGTAPRMFRRSCNYKYKGIVHNKIDMGNEKPVLIKDIAIVNLNFKEERWIEEKSIQNKRLMDIKIKQEGWNPINYLNYADIYRKLWLYKRRISDAEQAIYYLNKSLKMEFNLKFQETRNQLVREVEHAKVNSKSA